MSRIKSMLELIAHNADEEGEFGRVWALVQVDDGEMFRQLIFSGPLPTARRIMNGELKFQGDELVEAPQQGSSLVEEALKLAEYAGVVPARNPTVPLAVAVDEAMEAVMKKSSDADLSEALVTITKRIEAGKATPVDRFFVQEAADRIRRQGG